MSASRSRAEHPNLQLDATIEFLQRGLPRPPATVLDVGCGRGEVAQRLGRLGYEVTAIDVDRRAVAAARRHGVPAILADFLSYRAGPYDACVFVFSLHHLSPLSSAVRRARLLLRPDGRLLVNDKAWEAADASTAAWLYDNLRVLRSAGIAHAPRSLPTPGQSPLSFWRGKHLGVEHPGRKMVHEIQSRFVVQNIERVPYLYWNLGSLVKGSRRLAVSRSLLEIERQRIRDGNLRPLGLQIVAINHSPSASPPA
ncbi:MAG: class I SAM-dependent methyltransferase [Thermoplasmata archaeon]